MELNKYQTRDYISKLIAEYYSKSDNFYPDKIPEREFGAGDFDTKIRIRHLSFINKNDFKEYLIKKAPPFISCSTAFYKHPSFRPMENKEWLGSELVFDLDATDMNLECQKKHSTSWVCDICLDSVKSETLKLIEEFLIPDFGFSKNEIEVNFSGNRGYHVHIKKESVYSLDANARKQISDYITGNGINFDSFFVMEELRKGTGRSSKKLKGPKSSDGGWSGKIAKNFIKQLEAGPESLIKLGLESTLAKNLYKKKSLIELGINNGNWDMVYIKNKKEFWEDILKTQSIYQSDKIDQNVTNDPSHMVRLPNTIHGETGLISKKISVSDLNLFDPMSDTIAFDTKTIEVIANTNQELVMNKQTLAI
ncbi:MAG: DNA primase catalytic subunit PriS, partial [Candidatus Micrarchaeia archaeon]